MSKILYPVGTKVIVVNDIGFPGDDFTIGRTAEVIGYTKKSDNPRVCNGEPLQYRIKMQNGWITNASVKDLKRYNPAEAKVDQGNAPEQPESSACNCYTAEEVDVLLARQWEAVVRMLSNVDEVAMEALMNTHMIAYLTDHNFRKVAKQFKALNHDDD